MAKYVATNSIPTVDLGTHGDIKELQHVAKEIGSAFSATGCAFLSNHGIEEDLLKDAIAAQAKFFALNDDVKKQYISSEGTLLGYIPFDKEKYDPSTHDIHEGFIIVSEDEDKLPYSLVPSLQPAVTKAMTAFRALTFRLLSALSLALGQEHDYLAKMHQQLSIKKGFSCLRINHFPPQFANLPSNYVRFAAHKDQGSISVLFTGDVGGLQICDSDGTWTDVPPGKLLVLAGEILHFYSHKKFPAPVHRVLLPENAAREVARFSVIFFACPDTHLPYRPPSPEEPSPNTWIDYYSDFLKHGLAEKYQKQEHGLKN